MKKTLYLALVLLFSLNSLAGTWKKLTTNVSGSAGASTGTAGTALTPSQCPSGFIFIPKNTDYTASDFCVAKYEMKNNGYGGPVSQASGTPWNYMYANEMRAKCSSLGNGYSIISNNQWQTIARNIAGVASNWSGGAVGSGELNRGHSDSSPAGALAAAADTDPCNGTGQTCSTSTWNSQRRTHTLSNGNVIWDFAGNATEIMSDMPYTASNVSIGANGYISTMGTGDFRQTGFGAAAGTFCATPSATPYCGMGNGYFNTGSNQMIIRGGYWSEGLDAGVFAINSGLSDLIQTYTYNPLTVRNSPVTFTGFRCVFVP